MLSTEESILQQTHVVNLTTEEDTLSSLTHPLQQQVDDAVKITFSIESTGVTRVSLLKFSILKHGEERVGTISTFI